MTATRTAAEVVAAHYAAGARGDLPGMVADFSPAVRWTEAAGFAYAGTYVGPEAVVRHVFAALERDWEGFGFAPEELVCQTDRVIAWGRYFGRHRRTGASIDVRTAHRWQVTAGQVVAFEQVTDTALVDRAMRDGEPA